MNNTRQISAGLLMYRRRNGALELFLVHSGGPLFVHKWDGYWSIPKGVLEENEEPLQTAIREFEEETGLLPAGDNYIELGTVVQRSGKLVHAWAFEGEWPEGRTLKSNLFSLEWPPNSGRFEKFPEIDDGRFFTPEEARIKINERQIPLIDRLLAQLNF